VVKATDRIVARKGHAPTKKMQSQLKNSTTIPSILLKLRVILTGPEPGFGRPYAIGSGSARRRRRAPPVPALSMRADRYLTMAPSTFPVSPPDRGLSLCANTLESFGRQAIRIADGDGNDVVITIQPPGDLKGRIRAVPDQPIVNPPSPVLPPANSSQPMFIITNGHPWSWGVELAPLDPMLGSSVTNVQSDGTFRLTNVQAGRYRVDVGTPAGGFVKFMALDGRDCLNSGINLNGGAAFSGSLQIVVSMTAGQIGGKRIVSPEEQRQDSRNAGEVVAAAVNAGDWRKNRNGSMASTA